MATRKEYGDDFGPYLARQYDAAVAAGHPAHKDVNVWRSIARGEPVEPAETDDEGTEGETPMAGGGPGATDSRRWRNASTPVRVALDSAMQPGRSPSDSLALAEASLRQSGWDSELMTELRSYHAAATAPRGAADATSKIPGYGRLR
jgi:hypothetical protein